MSLATFAHWAGHGLVAWAWVGPALLAAAQLRLVRALERPRSPG